MNTSWKHYAKVKEDSHKITGSMILFMWNAQNGPVYKNRKQISGLEDLREIGE